MSTVTGLHEKATALWNELNNTETECLRAMNEMHEETVSASPHYEEYIKAQDEMLEAQRNHDDISIIRTLNYRFMEANDKAVTTSPLYGEYKKICYTHKMITEALRSAGNLSSILSNLESVGKNWVSNPNK